MPVALTKLVVRKLNLLGVAIPIEALPFGHARTIFGRGNMNTTISIPRNDLREIRLAMRELLHTHQGRSSQALKAADNARRAYLLTFTEEEKARVLALAQSQKANAPQGHFLRSSPPLDSFEQAVAWLGTQLIDSALGD